MIKNGMLDSYSEGRFEIVNCPKKVFSEGTTRFMVQLNWRNQLTLVEVKSHCKL